MSTAAPPNPGEWTVRRVLEWTIGHLKERGSESPRLDAEVLLAHAWKCPRIQLYTRYDQPLPEDVRTTMRDLVKRRAACEPVAYLIGRREFFSLEFEVQPGVFIPRPDTETLVIEALRLMEPIPEPRVLDLCTGTGCIAVSIAHSRPACRVTAVDLNSVAVEIATRNAARHNVSERVRVLQGDLFAPLPGDGAFDLIVSNPPYVRDDELPDLMPDIREHEPHLCSQPEEMVWTSCVGSWRACRTGSRRVEHCCWRSARSRPPRRWKSPSPAGSSAAWTSCGSRSRGTRGPRLAVTIARD